MEHAGHVWGERSEEALCVNFVLRTAHAEEKKKGGHKPRRTYDNNNNIIMKNRRCTIHVGLTSLAQLHINSQLATVTEGIAPASTPPPDPWSRVLYISLLGGVYGEYTTRDRSQSKFARYSLSRRRGVYYCKQTYSD